MSETARHAHRHPCPPDGGCGVHQTTANHGDLAIVAEGLTKTFPAGKHKTFTTIASAQAAESAVAEPGGIGPVVRWSRARDQRFEVAGAKEAGRHHV